MRSVKLFFLPVLLIQSDFPVEIPAMGQTTVLLKFYHESIDTVTDSIHISNNDSRNPDMMIPFTANVQRFFTVTDNEDSLSYTESV